MDYHPHTISYDHMSRWRKRSQQLWQYLPKLELRSPMKSSKEVGKQSSELRPNRIVRLHSMKGAVRVEIMNVARGLCWGESRSTRPCVFPCKVAAAGDERHLACAAGAAGDISSLNRFLLRVLQRVVVHVCVILCVCWLSGCRSQCNGCKECCISLFCNEWLFMCAWIYAFVDSLVADPSVVAASRLLGTTAACGILMSFAAGHCKSYSSGCINAAIVICQQIFSMLALVIFLWKLFLKSASKSCFLLVKCVSSRRRVSYVASKCSLGLQWERWDELKWGDVMSEYVRRDQMIWHEIRCRVRSTCSLDVVCQRGRTQVTFSGSSSTTSSHKAHAHGTRHTAHASSIDEKSLIIKSKATSAPPRAGTTGTSSYQLSKEYGNTNLSG